MDHSDDITIIWYLLDDISKHGYSLRLIQALDTHPATLDLLVITQGTRGRFPNAGPRGIEGVLQDDLKEILKPGEHEEKVRKVLLQEFGRWTHERVPHN